MCGIAGFVGAGSLPEAAERSAVLARMLRVIEHRGPDDEGATLCGTGGVAALGMRRLAVIDLHGGQQPMNGCAADVTIVFNGEIYNFRDVQRGLEVRGHRFRTNSDTEAIAHAYEEHGSACVEHLRGMFAFAVWDEARGELFLARDRVGKKPLYYTLTPHGTLVFGSELKSLLEHPEVGRDVDPAALDAYVTYGYVPDPLAIFRGVRKLPPGAHLTFRPGDREPSVKQYWDFPYARTADEAGANTNGHGATTPSTVAPPRAEDHLTELRAQLDEAVRVRLVADVPLGAFLSGGVDSSAVVGLMARHTPGRVKTFSIGFREDSFDELKYARLAAKHFQTDHHEFVVTPQEVCATVDKLVWHLDEPFADSSALPTYAVSRLARQHVTVALSGDGGDELFAGYTRYVVDRRRDGFARLPRALRRALLRPLSRALPHGAPGRNFLHNVSLDPLARYVDSLSTFTALNKPRLYAQDFARGLGLNGTDPATQDFLARAGVVAGSLERMLYLDSKTYLPGDILVKVDRMSMAASLETRAPLLDHKLIEYVCRLPAALKLNGLETKSIFKRAVAGLVPDELLHRPKQGFGVPVNQWINDELRGYIRDVLAEPRTRQRGYFDASYVNLLLDEHSRGRRDHSAQLWSLFVLELWHRTFADAPLPSLA